MPNSTSMLGRYVPPGPDIADGYDRESRYITVDDGCRIAVDILHPAAGGVRLDGPRPTVLHATPYRRAWLRAENSRTAARYEQALAGIEPGQLVTQYETRPLATTLIHQGYNFVSLDLRGTGASSGASYIDSWRAGLDIAQVIDWIVDQPWATGKVGMVGISYEGMAQFFTAAFAPAGLACIVPQYPGLPQCYVDGGLAISGFARTWEALHKGISEDEPSAPVDGPDGPQLRADAEAERDPSRYDWVEDLRPHGPPRRDPNGRPRRHPARTRPLRPRPAPGRLRLDRRARSPQRRRRPHLHRHRLVGPHLPRLPDRRLQPPHRPQEADRRPLEPRPGR